MRITDKIIQQRVITGLKQSAQKLSKTHNRIATTKNLSCPSDDPIGSAKLMSHYKELYKVSQTIKNCENSLNFLHYNDVILEKVGELISETRNKAAFMASDTVDSDARKTVGSEMEIIIDQMMQLANSTFSGKHIFAGHKILQTPYTKDASGNISYQGDQGEIKQRVELGNQTMKINTIGSDVFGQGTEINGIFKIFADLKNALNSNNVIEINTSLSLLDNELDRIAMFRGELGVKINRTQTSKDGMQILEISLKNNISKIEDVDMAEEAGKFITNQEAYQSALQATSTILKLPKLTDYLS